MATTNKKYVSIEKLGLYHEKEVARVNGLIDAAKGEANAYADSLASNYDVAGSAVTEAGKVQAELDKEVIRAKAAEEANSASAKKAQDDVDALKLVVDTKAAQSDLQALAGKVGEVPEGSTVMGIIGEIQENAYDDTKLREDMATELAKKADKTQVATDIETAVKAEEDARKAAIEGVQGAVNTLSETHATDKKALEDRITEEVNTLNETLNDYSFDLMSNVAKEFNNMRTEMGEEHTRIEGLVTAEAERAAGVEAGLDARLVGVEAFFELADGEKLDEAKDTLIEIQKLIDADAAAADEMLKDIAENAKAISDHVAIDHDFAGADAALKSELEGKINGKVAQSDFDAVEDRVEVAEGKITVVEGKVSTLEGQMTTVQGAVATKAEAQALTDAVAALEGADAGQIERIAALEAKFGEGEGNVEDMIGDAKQEAIDAAKEDATTKANAAKDAAIAKANELNTAMDARVGVVEAKAHEHANKELLDTYTQTNADLADAVAKKHEHSNLTILEGITAEKVTAWDKVGSKADQTSLQSEIERATAKEAELLAAINAFEECSEGDINALFE